MNKRQKRIRKNISIAIAKKILKSRNLIDFEVQVIRLRRYGYNQLPEEYFQKIIDKKQDVRHPFPNFSTL